MTMVKRVRVTGRQYGFTQLLLAALVFTATGIGITQLAKGYHASIASSTGTPPLPISLQYEAPNQEVTLRLNADGFVPAELTRGAGPFQLSIDNRSGVEELTLILSRSNGTQVRELRIPRGGGDWSEVLDLEVGRYALTVADHTNLVCFINIR